MAEVGTTIHLPDVPGDRKQATGGVKMAFTKIRETVAAFRPSRVIPTLEEKRLVQHAQQQARRLSEQPTVAPTAPPYVIRFVLVVIVVIPVSLFVSWLLYSLFHFDERLVGIVSSAILTFAISSLHRVIVDRIVARVPMHKFGVHFGSKIEETIAAFRTTEQKKSSQSHPPKPIR